MIVTFLGTGHSQGIPVIACDCAVCQSKDPKDTRLRTSVHVEAKGLSLVIDTGPDFRQQMLRENIRRLDAVLFTHQHKDHIAGLDDVRSFNFKQQRPMPVYGNYETLAQIKRDFYYAFGDNTYPGVPQLELVEILNREFQIGELKILPIDVLHYNMQVYGFRIGSFTYITDANYISDEEKEKALDSDVLVLNALFRKNHYSHFSLEQAVALAQELNARKTYFVHMSHKMGLHAEIMRELPENIELAYDGLKIEIQGA